MLDKRLEKGLLQKKVVVHLGVSEGIFRFWENDSVYLRIKYFPKIIEFFRYIPLKVDTSSLSGKIKLYRHVFGLTYREVGKLLGADGSTARCFEKDEFILSETKTKKIGELLNK